MPRSRHNTAILDCILVWVYCFEHVPLGVLDSAVPCAPSNVPESSDF